MGSDARVRYTKMAIKNSLMTLLKEKPLNKITVKELCQLSEINRATFYKYYCDVFDLVKKLEQDFLDELTNHIQGNPQRNFRETFKAILVNLKADGELYQTLFSDNGDKAFPNRILSLGYENSLMEQDERFGSLTTTQRKWLYYFVAQGCCGILEQWLSNGLTEPIDEVADFADGLLQNIFKCI